MHHLQRAGRNLQLWGMGQLQRSGPGRKTWRKQHRLSTAKEGKRQNKTKNSYNPLKILSPGTTYRSQPGCNC